jgi:hypothetical protein
MAELAADGGLPSWFSSEKNPLGKGWAYPLKATALVRALEFEHLTIDTHLRQIHGSWLLRGHFWPLSPNVGYDRLYVVACAVPSANLATARESLASEVLPTFALWARRILDQPADSPARRQKQDFELADDTR